MNRSRLLMSLGLCAGLTACSSSQVANKEAADLIEQGQYEAGLARVEEGLRENPRDTELHLLLQHLAPNGEPELDFADEITSGACVARPEVPEAQEVDV